MLDEARSHQAIYRAFPLTRDGAISAPALFIHAADDQDAVRQANAMATGHSLELWDGSRLVAKITVRRNVN